MFSAIELQGMQMNNFCTQRMAVSLFKYQSPLVFFCSKKERKDSKDETAYAAADTACSLQGALRSLIAYW